ncbi:hypothetical protein [Salinirubrum litoreum]|uniref:Uncharacterized protein n=1 Tax=Salinirubrum litoreum TaxID=1126234 RepID=A0ABD5REM0_9EURY|nr:hypothetical protein [Salinirubrum litoreum]
MSTDNPNPEIDGTIGYLIKSFVGYIGMAMILAIFVVPSAVIAGIIIGRLDPSASPFIWLATLGFLAGMMGHAGKKDIAQGVEVAERMQSWTRKEAIIYMGGLMMIMFGMIISEITLLSLLSGAISGLSEEGVIVGVLIAIIGPVVDAWVGRNSRRYTKRKFGKGVGISFANLGYYIAYLLLVLVILAQDIPKEIARSARDDIDSMVWS